MDPSQIQGDKANDVHSLESGGDPGGKEQNGPDKKEELKEVVSADGKTKVTDASGSAAPPSLTPTPVKQAAIRRIWRKFNIYLLMFVLVIVIAVGILVALTITSRRTTQVSLNPQGLSDSALEQLANTDVTVGDAKQVLTVQSNAVFAGSVLVRSNLEVAGTLKVGGAVSFSELGVSGKSKLADVEVESLTVGSSLALQGSLSVKGGLSVSGSASFTGNVVVGSLQTGSLTLSGDLNLTQHITAGGTIPQVAKGSAVGSGGTVSLSGSDTGGSVVVNTGTAPPAGCFATVTFSKAFANTPHVVITPVGTGAAGLDYYITRSTTNFVICTTNSAPDGATFGFDYIVFA